MFSRLQSFCKAKKSLTIWKLIKPSIMESTVPQRFGFSLHMKYFSTCTNAVWQADPTLEDKEKAAIDKSTAKKKARAEYDKKHGLKNKLPPKPRKKSKTKKKKGNKKKTAKPKTEL